MAAKKPQKERAYTEEEKKEIALKLIKGYKRMASLNLEIAEEGMKLDDETE